jgi:hypothetical protein
MTRGLVALAALLALWPAAAARAATATDPRDAAASPLDVRDVSFGQRELRLELTLRTQDPWTSQALAGDRSLCLVLARGRLCAGSRHGRPALLFQAQPSGVLHKVDAAVTRPDPRTFHASVLPSTLGLPLGPLRWSVESHWGCPAGCDDAVPDSGTLRAAVVAYATPPCFGAAARLRPCGGGGVYPRPDQAYIWPSSRCRPLHRPLGACEFGVAGARDTVALLGDSHATHWRAALEVVAQARRWRGISITRPGCPFSVQIPGSPALGPAACAAQHAAALAWLRAHPAVRTVFVSDWAEPPGGPQGGTGGYGGGAAQFGAMLDALPRSVRHVYVLRDIPATTLASTVCVRARLRRGAPVGSRCFSPRAAVLTPDPGAQAADARRPRVRTIDLTRLFCRRTRCLPVIGGVYVHKDDNHMNAVFAATLGPYVLREVRSG